MRCFTLLFLLVMFISVTSCKKEIQKKNDTSYEDILKIMKTQNSIKEAKKEDVCNMDLLIEVSKKINNLNINLVEKFLISYEYECTNSIEFYEYRNELLFSILDKSPSLILKIISNNREINKQNLYKDIQNPITDKINLEKLLNTLNKSNPDNIIKREIISALNIAKNKD